MSIYNKKFWWKLSLIVFAMLIALISLYYTNKLVKSLSLEEAKKVELWAEATRLLGSTETDNIDFGFLLAVIQNNRTVPVILTDSADNIISYRNIDSVKAFNLQYLKKELEYMKNSGNRITIQVGEHNINYVYYKESYLLYQLRIYPYIQLAIILLFIMVAYFAFSSSRKAEQNQVWIGLTKETAHQLGTPTSSLMALSELLHEKELDSAILSELDNDIKRLAVITERFSKIGSKPVLASHNINRLLEHVIEYLRNRISKNIHIVSKFENEIYAMVSPTLFEWVIENLFKNAVDAMDGKGTLMVILQSSKNNIFIDITDTGKGIAKSRFKTIFKPGYTTKNRGWGLGLSLAKRIIENYHKGKIFVLHSELNKGTTFRIVLKKISK